MTYALVRPRGAAGRVDHRLVDAAQHRAEPHRRVVRALAPEGVHEGVRAVAERGHHAALLQRVAGRVPQCLVGRAAVLGEVLRHELVLRLRVAARLQTGVEQGGQLIARDAVRADQRDRAAAFRERPAETGEQRGLTAVDRVRHHPGELVGGDAVAPDVGDAGALQRGEEGVAELAVGADDGDHVLVGRAPGALGGVHAVVVVVAGQDLDLTAAEAALGVDPLGVGEGHRRHARFVGGVGVLRRPGHDLDGVRGARDGREDPASCGERGAHGQRAQGQRGRPAGAAGRGPWGRWREGGTCGWCGACRS